MIIITKKQFNKIQKSPYPLQKNIIDYSYNGVLYPAGSIMCGFAGIITGDFKSCSLMFEHVHFEIEK